MKEKEIFVGPCSKFVNGQGWTTEIPIEMLKEKGYIKIKDLNEKFVSLRAVKVGEKHPSAMKALVESIGCVQKDTAKKFADLVEFHSIACMNDGVEYFTISVLGLKEILVEEFGFKYSELNGVEVE